MSLSLLEFESERHARKLISKSSRTQNVGLRLFSVRNSVLVLCPDLCTATTNRRLLTHICVFILKDRTLQIVLCFLCTQTACVAFVSKWKFSLVFIPYIAYCSCYRVCKCHYVLCSDKFAAKIIPVFQVLTFALHPS